MDDKTLETTILSALTPENAPAVEPEKDKAPEDATKVDAPVTPPEVEPVQTTESDVETKPTPPESNPVRQLRTQLETTKQEAAKHQRILQKLADAKGITVEQLEIQIQEEEDRKTAQAKGVPPEVQRQLREQQDRIRTLEEEGIRADFNRRAENFRREVALTDEAMVEFAKQAKSAGINIFTPGLNLTDLYRALNYSSISATMKEQIRQEVLREIEAQKKNGSTITAVPGATPAVPSTAPTNESAWIKQIVEVVNKQ